MVLCSLRHTPSGGAAFLESIVYCLQSDPVSVTDRSGGTGMRGGSLSWCPRSSHSSSPSLKAFGWSFLYSTSDPGFVIMETAHSFSRYDCASADADAFSKAINLSMSILHHICFQQHFPICAVKAAPPRASGASGVQILAVNVTAGFRCTRVFFVTRLQKHQSCQVVVRQQLCELLRLRRIRAFTFSGRTVNKACESGRVGGERNMTEGSWNYEERLWMFNLYPSNSLMENSHGISVAALGGTYTSIT